MCGFVCVCEHVWQAPWAVKSCFVFVVVVVVVVMICFVFVVVAVVVGCCFKNCHV